MNETSSSDHKDAPRFLIVDDHPMVRDSMHGLIRTLKPNGQTDLAINLAMMRKTLRQNPPYDYALVDLNLPDANGIEVLRAARECQPDLSLIVFSARIEQDLILRCLNFGVVGYIPKTHYNDMVLQALRMIFAGQVYIPQQAVFERDRQGYGAAIRSASALRSSSDPRQLGMTERQVDVLRLILRGLPNKLICRKLKLAEGTVKVHVSAVLRALGVRNRTQAVIAATERGLRCPDG